jgi:flagellar basal body P-ring formation protein FlgA
MSRAHFPRDSVRSAARLALALAALLGCGPGLASAGETIPVPTITIYPGDVIRDAMLTERDLPSDFAGRGATILSRDSLVGKAARRTLLPGLPIPSNAVGEPKVVALGAMVRIVYQEGGLTISTYGSALRAGAVGDVIPVRNNETGLTVSGTIEQDGSIRVSEG